MLTVGVDTKNSYQTCYCAEITGNLFAQVVPEWSKKAHFFNSERKMFDALVAVCAFFRALDVLAWRDGRSSHAPSTCSCLFDNKLCDTTRVITITVHIYDILTLWRIRSTPVVMRHSIRMLWKNLKHIITHYLWGDVLKARNKLKPCWSNGRYPEVRSKGHWFELNGFFYLKNNVRKITK